MPHRSSFEDFIDTEPIPVQQPVADMLNTTHETAPRRRVLSVVGAIALSGLISSGAAYGTTVVIRTTQQAGILSNSLPEKTERNLEVSAFAADLLDNPDVKISCDTKATEAISQDNLHALAYVQEYNVSGEVFVPPYITMHDELCADIIEINHPSPLKDGENENYMRQLREQKLGRVAAILLHEYEHIEGIFNEAKATCYAVQKLPATLTPYLPTAHEALDVAKTSALALSYEVAPDYLSDKCKAGDAYDLDISSVYINNDSTKIG